MLKELYDYAVSHALVAVPGMKERAVKAYIALDKSGKFLGFEPAIKAKVYCPDMGSATQGDKSNVLIEKADIVLDLARSAEDSKTYKRHIFFIEALKNGVEYEPDFELCYDFLCTPSKLEQLREAFSNTKFKPRDAVGFIVDGVPLEKGKKVGEWWQNFRQMQVQKKLKDESRCFITGELTEPMETVPKVSGLLAVGGHSSGDALICYDKKAFQSYGLSKSYNCTVSETAITAVNAALGTLIADAPIYAGVKIVHWYSGPVEDDVMSLPKMDFDIGPTAQGEEKDVPEQDEAERESSEKLKELFKSVYAGTIPAGLEKYRYYLIPMSGAGGRVMIRGYDEGNCAELYHNFHLWYQELKLCKMNNKQLCKFPKLYSIYMRMLKPQSGNDMRKISERIGKELGGLSVKFINAITHHHPLPDSAAQAALRYIRSEMLRDHESKGQKVPDAVACQILKVWFIRKGYGDMKESLNENCSDNDMIYHLGRLVAVYGAIQKRANPDVGVGVVEKYFSAASTTPAFVIGKLAVLSIHHLKKLTEKEYIYFSNILNGIWACIPKEKVPENLNMKEQTEFVMGYYHQCASMFKKKSKDQLTSVPANEPEEK